MILNYAPSQEEPSQSQIFIEKLGCMFCFLDFRSSLFFFELLRIEKFSSLGIVFYFIVDSVKITVYFFIRMFCRYPLSESFPKDCIICDLTVQELVKGRGKVAEKEINTSSLIINVCTCNCEQSKQFRLVKLRQDS